MPDEINQTRLSLRTESFLLKNSHPRFLYPASYSRVTRMSIRRCERFGLLQHVVRVVRVLLWSQRISLSAHHPRDASRVLQIVISLVFRSAFEWIFHSAGCAGVRCAKPKRDVTLDINLNIFYGRNALKYSCAMGEGTSSSARQCAIAAHHSKCGKWNPKLSLAPRAAHLV